jgi:hypothetical protein
VDTGSVELDGSHVVMISQPGAVAELIRAAIAATSGKSVAV